MPDPILVGRNEAKLAALAAAHGVERWTTDLDAALANPDDELFFDAATTQLRAGLIRRAIEAGKHVYTEKPTADTLADAVDVARLAKRRGIKHGVVQDKLFLPGPAQAEARDRQRLPRPHAQRARRVRLLGVRGRLAAGAAPELELQGGRGRRHHPRYALPLALRARQPVRRGRERLLPRRHPHPRARGRSRPHLPGRHRRRRLRHVPARGRGDRAHQLAPGPPASGATTWSTFHVDGTHGSAVAGLQKCWTQARINTPKPVWNPDIPQTIDFFRAWDEVPDNQPYPNGFRAQWELFLRYVAGETDELPVGPGGRRARRAARRSRAAELARAPLDRPSRRWSSERCRPSPSPAPTAACNPTRRSRRAPFPPPGRRSTASRSPRRTSWPTRSPTAIRGSTPAIDWDRTIDYRAYLWSLGLGVAESMDTAQRGMGLDWPTQPGTDPPQPGRARRPAR